MSLEKPYFYQKKKEEHKSIKPMYEIVESYGQPQLV